MLDSVAMKQIQKTIEILNNLNDNEKDLVLNDINSKLEPFKNDGTIKKKPKKKVAFRIEKTKIQLDKFVRVTSLHITLTLDTVIRLSGHYYEPLGQI